MRWLRVHYEGRCLPSVEVCPMPFPSSLLLPLTRGKILPKHLLCLFKLLSKNNIQECFPLFIATLVITRNHRLYFWRYIQKTKSWCSNSIQEKKRGKICKPAHFQWGFLLQFHNCELWWLWYPKDLSKNLVLLSKGKEARPCAGCSLLRPSK